MTRAWSALVGLAVAAPFYWLLIDTASSPELIAGAVAAVIAAGAYSAAYFESTRRPAFKARWLSVVARELAKVPAGVLVVCREIFAQTLVPRARRGVLATELLELGDGDEHDLGRRALAEATRSLAPNTIVIGADPDSDRLVLHRLGRAR